jgi:hypothetical protein
VEVVNMVTEEKGLLFLAGKRARSCQESCRLF